MSRSAMLELAASTGAKSSFAYASYNVKIGAAVGWWDLQKNDFKDRYFQQQKNQ